MEYTTSTYTWKIISVDTLNHHMVVEYSTDSVVDKLNLPIPAKEEDIAAYIDRFAPKKRWEQKDPVNFDHVSENMSGTLNLNVSEQSGQSENSQFTGSFHEEYIRALIYQVLEEINDESL
jgi:hypothetical protein